MSDHVFQDNAENSTQLILPPIRKAERFVFVIRGDLTSTTGYGKATRALAALLRNYFEIYGVDLHAEQNSELSAFNGQLIEDKYISNLCERVGVCVIVLNYTTPDNFSYFKSALNIGSFYWETSSIPIHGHWRELIYSMDYMWAPSAYVMSLLIGMGYSRPVFLVTWPHDFSRKLEPIINADLKVKYIDNLWNEDVISTDVESIKTLSTSLFLSVKSMAPRKGLPVLLSEWRDHVSENDNHDILLLKLRFVHNSRLTQDNEDHIIQMIREAGFTRNSPIRIAYIIEDLADNEMEYLYRSCSAYITASYGEGFGGPVVEALLFGAPVIASLNTGMADLLPDDYCLAFDSDALHVELKGNSLIYPSASTWEVPRRGAIRETLKRYNELSLEQRDIAIATARSHAEAFCSQNAVKAQIDAFLRHVGLQP